MPKPLNETDLQDLISIAKSGLYSRYTTDYVKELECDLSSYYGTSHAVTVPPEQLLCMEC